MRLASFLLFIVGSAAAIAAGERSAPMNLQVTSTSFSANGAIPKVHTCEGGDKSPPLAWSGAPASTRSFVLIVDDPDAPDPAAPKMTWVHWVLYNLPASAKGLREAVVAKDLPPGTLDGVNDWKRIGYGGPCPPVGRHRYFFKLYALDVILPDLGQPNKAALEQAMQSHVMAQGQLIGTYRKH